MVWVIKWRYPGGWGKAAVMGLVAWVAALIILGLVSALAGLSIGAFGVPGV